MRLSDAIKAGLWFIWLKFDVPEMDFLEKSKAVHLHETTSEMKNKGEIFYYVLLSPALSLGMYTLPVKKPNCSDKRSKNEIILTTL